MDQRCPPNLKIDKGNFPKYCIFIFLCRDIKYLNLAMFMLVYIYIAYVDNNWESNSLRLLLKTFLIMDGFIDVVTDVGPGAVVKGVISGTLRMAIPAMLADKVGCGYF